MNMVMNLRLSESRIYPQLLNDYQMRMEGPGVGVSRLKRFNIIPSAAMPITLIAIIAGD